MTCAFAGRPPGLREPAAPLFSLCLSIFALPTPPPSSLPHSLPLCPSPHSPPPRPSLSLFSKVQDNDTVFLGSESELRNGNHGNSSCPVQPAHCCRSMSALHCASAASAIILRFPSWVSASSVASVQRCSNHINTSHTAAFNTAVQEDHRVITDLSRDLCWLGRRPNNKPLSVSGGEVPSELGRVGGGLLPGRSPPRSI